MPTALRSRAACSRSLRSSSRKMVQRFGDLARTASIAPGICAVHHERYPSHMVARYSSGMPSKRSRRQQYQDRMTSLGRRSTTTAWSTRRMIRAASGRSVELTSPYRLPQTIARSSKRSLPPYGSCFTTQFGARLSHDAIESVPDRGVARTTKVMWRASVVAMLAQATRRLHPRHRRHDAPIQEQTVEP